MGSSKKEQYSHYQLEFAIRSKALGHAARIAIVEHLAQFAMATNEELRKLVQLNGATVFQHLQVLLHAGLIGENFLNNKHFYYLKNSAKTEFLEVTRVFDSNRRFQE